MEGLGKIVLNECVGSFLSPLDNTRLRATSTFFRETVSDKAIAYTNNTLKQNFQLACKTGHLDIVQLMIQHKVTKFQKGFEIACAEGHINIVKFLIQNEDMNVFGGLIQACLEGHVDIVKFMVQNIYSELETTDFNAGLEIACSNGHMDIVKFMIQSGATNFNMGLKVACFNGHMDIVKSMIQSGATNLDDAINAVRRIRGHLKDNMELLEFQRDQPSIKRNK